MTVTSKNAQLPAGMVELSDADLDAVSGGTLGLLLYAKISLVKSIFSVFGKGHGSYGDKNDHKDYDDHGDKNKPYGKKK
ncbi:MAG: hypothetical protein JNM09_28325 [Blastocatellia bacterium]|nr:hypothetical protein [Blastocatellia bacterium]